MASGPDILLRDVSFALVVTAVWEIARGWRSAHDRYHKDMLWVFGLLAAILLFGDRAATLASEAPIVRGVVTLLFLLQPYFLLRLVRRFRHVPRGLVWLTAGIGVLVAVTAAVRPVPRSSAITTALAASFVVQLSYAAWAFEQEARRAGAVTGTRLWFIALGTVLHVVIAVTLAAEVALPSLAELGPEFRQLIGLGVFGCYYAGLIAPRRWRSIWAQQEWYRHLRRSTGREPRDRAREAPSDLSRAVGYGVASVGRAVLLFDERQPDVLSTRAANASGWGELTVRPGSGLIGRCLGRMTPVAGAPQDYEPEVAKAIGRSGHSVLAVPIASDGRRWGVLLVVQRQGSLFPDDDIDFMEELCKHTAATLDHARLAGTSDGQRQRSAGALA